MNYLKDPLTLFLLFGLIIFFVERLASDADDADYLIEVTSGQQNRIFDQWQAQMGRPPTEEEAAGLLDQWVREEIFYREAKKLGLDDNDTIIRRRLSQKLTFLNEDLANAEEPSEEALSGYFEEHIDDYLIPEQYTFQHRYFSSDRRQDAESDARTALTAGDVTGDPFILQKSYADRSSREIGDLFGAAFAEAVARLETGRQDDWQGPIPSAYGWHLVRLTDRTSGREPLMTEVADAVRRDYLQDRRRKANSSFYQSLRARYDIRLAEAAQ